MKALIDTEVYLYRAAAACEFEAEWPQMIGPTYHTHFTPLGPMPTPANTINQEDCDRG